MENATEIEEKATGRRHSDGERTATALGDGTRFQQD
jgi:hypothetical protein